MLAKPWEYADGMAKKMFKVEKLIWCTPQQLHKLVAALEYAKARATTPPSAPLQAEGELVGGFNSPSIEGVSRSDGVVLS